MTPDPTDALARVEKALADARWPEVTDMPAKLASFDEISRSDIEAVCAELRRWRAGSGEGPTREQIAQVAKDVSGAYLVSSTDSRTVYEALADAVLALFAHPFATPKPGEPE